LGGESLLRLQIQDQGCSRYRLYPSATQAARWKPRVSDNQIRAHRIDTDAAPMNATEICEPTSITDQRKLWAAFVAGYTSTHQCSVVNARRSHEYLYPPKLTFEGVGTTAVTRRPGQRLHRSVKALLIIVNSRSIITEEIFHDCGSAGATSE
jgi:hypothetical protein